MLDGGIHHHPGQPGDQKNQQDVPKRITDDLPRVAIGGKRQYGEPPDLRQQFDEGHGQQNAQQHIHHHHQTHAVGTVGAQECGE